MPDKFSSDFINALKNHDTQTLLSIPKSDVHNHLGRGCRVEWLSEKMNHTFAKPPAVFDGLLGMQDWYVNNIRDYCRAHDSNQTDFRREGCFAEAERNHLARFAPSFSETDIEDYGSLKNFCDYYDSLHKKYCPDAVYEPELAYQSYADIESKLAKAEEYFSSGYFKSIDVCCGEGYKTFSDYIPLYKIAEKYGVLKRMHVGETGTAEDIEEAIDSLGLDEIHHGINAVNSPKVMKLLADRKITLNVCPTSNIKLGYAKSYAEHPIKILVENGVPVTINTDDLLIFDSSIDEEYQHLYDAGTLTAEHLDEIRCWGISNRIEK